MPHTAWATIATATSFSPCSRPAPSVPLSAPAAYANATSAIADGSVKPVHAASAPDILDTSTTRVLDKAWRLGLLATEEAEVLRSAVRLYHDLTQILRLCLSAPFDPLNAAPGLVGLLTRAADVPDFGTLEAHLAETETKVRASFKRIVGASP